MPRRRVQSGSANARSVRGSSSSFPSSPSSSISPPTLIQSRLELFTYAISRLPPRQLPLLALYAYWISYTAGRWIDPVRLGKAGTAIVGVLSMVTGLLLSYRFSTAMSRWDEGKKVWVGVHTLIRDGIRILSIPSSGSSMSTFSNGNASLLSSPPTDSCDTPSEHAISSASSPQISASTLTAVNPSARDIPAPIGRRLSSGGNGGPLSTPKRRGSTDQVIDRTDELAGLFVGFAFALQHHLHGTRPLPQAPLSDLLPLSYLSSLKRTEARVRFAESHAGPRSSEPSSLSKKDGTAGSKSPGSFGNESGSTHHDGLRLRSGDEQILGSRSGSGSRTERVSGNEADKENDDDKSGESSSTGPFEGSLSRPGMRRRSTGPPSEEERHLAAKDDESELDRLRDHAETVLAKLSQALAGGLNNDAASVELRQQLSQLNLPPPKIDFAGNSISASASSSTSTYINGANSSITGTLQQDSQLTRPSSPQPSKPRSNLHAPNPPNLPLSLLKLMDAYINGLGDISQELGGWSEARRERALGIVKSLNELLGSAERLNTTPPPLPLTLHLSHLLIIYLLALPCSLLCVISGWPLVLVTVIAGWCLLGLDALVGEVGGVFGDSENHHPLPRLAHQILVESLDTSPAFMRYYRSRLVLRLGEDADEVDEIDRRSKGRVDEWMPSF